MMWLRLSRQRLPLSKRLILPFEGPLHSLWGGFFLFDTPTFGSPNKVQQTLINLVSAGILTSAW